MKIANVGGRLCLVRDGRTLDVGEASGGSLPTEPAEAYRRWPELVEWADQQPDAAFTDDFDDAAAGPPSPSPAQIFTLGTNYRGHATELGWPIPEVPMVFTKFPSSLAGPGARVEVTGPHVDWEVELVVIIGTGGHRIPADQAWSAIAGFTVGQDISDRDVQGRPASTPQFSLGKSFPGFSPTGPVAVTRDEIDDPHNLRLRCWVNDTLMQDGCTDDFVFDIPFLIEYLSGIVTLLPGDLIFTGTPSGVGTTMSPPQFLAVGDRVSSTIDGIGSFETTFVERR